MKYTVTAYSFEHGGEINKTAKSKKEAIAVHDEMAKTVLHDLNVSKNNMASIVVSTPCEVILKSMVSHGQSGKVVVSRKNYPFGKAIPKKAA